ncbi:tetratricopeptide repeat protein [Dokdonia sp. Hel_I_53]|uniref:tetratricopeptide repeat protein n=1 Tax=Dokdonia sp. Hel_I_53 TaxID=1566287 RepID=UPI00119BA168|nr:tetratricopeptide repeat protein [Dokdonia sp. Hel_I_53]TVZ52803.1 SH3 domain-containing protein [Dokdonia sp. Hel_I_53]
MKAFKEKSSIQQIITILILVSTASLYAQAPSQIFEMGNAHYAEGRYQEAIDTYRKILDSDLESAGLYYNLANAHYKLNNVAPSIYYYEKAKLLDPTDNEINNNAQFAQKMKIDGITPLPESIFKKWHSSILNFLTIDGWAYTTVFFVFLFVVLFVSYYFVSQSATKRILFLSFTVSLIIAGISLMFAYNAFAKAEKDNPAIVFAIESQVKSEPNLRSTDAFTLHEGTKVMILDTVKNWNQIRIADGKTGWIQAADVKKL